VLRGRPEEFLRERSRGPVIAAETQTGGWITSRCRIQSALFFKFTKKCWLKPALHWVGVVCLKPCLRDYSSRWSPHSQISTVSPGL
jgi:hypothetical protein